MRAKEYEAIVEDCLAGGMTIREYSEKIGVSVQKLHTWIRRTGKRRGIKDDRKSYEEYRANRDGVQKKRANGKGLVRRAGDPIYGLLRLGEKGQQKRRTGKDRRDVRDPTVAPWEAVSKTERVF